MLTGMAKIEVNSTACQQEDFQVHALESVLWSNCLGVKTAVHAYA